MTNKDGLEPNKQVDFETLQRVKRKQRDAAKAQREAPKDAKEKPKGKPGRPAKGSEGVRESGKSDVQGVLRSETPKGSEE